MRWQGDVRRVERPGRRAAHSRLGLRWTRRLEGRLRSRRTRSCLVPLRAVVLWFIGAVGLKAVTVQGVLDAARSVALGVLESARPICSGVGVSVPEYGAFEKASARLLKIRDESLLLSGV